MGEAELRSTTVMDVCDIPPPHAWVPSRVVHGSQKKSFMSFQLLLI